MTPAPPTAQMLFSSAEPPLAGPSTGPTPGTSESVGTALSVLSQGASIGGGLISQGATPEVLGQVAQAAAGAGAAMLAGKAAPAVLGEIVKSAAGAAVTQGVGKALSSLGESTAPNLAGDAFSGAAPKVTSTLGHTSPTSDTGLLGEATGSPSAHTNQAAAPAESIASEGSKATSAPTGRDVEAKATDPRAIDPSQPSSSASADPRASDVGELEASREAADERTDDAANEPAEDADDLAASSAQDASTDDGTSASDVQATPPSVESAASIQSQAPATLGTSSQGTSILAAAGIATASTTAATAIAAAVSLAPSAEKGSHALTTGYNPGATSSAEPKGWRKLVERLKGKKSEASNPTSSTQGEAPTSEAADPSIASQLAEAKQSISAAEAALGKDQSKALKLASKADALAKNLQKLEDRGTDSVSARDLNRALASELDGIAGKLEAAAQSGDATALKGHALELDLLASRVATLTSKKDGAKERAALDQAVKALGQFTLNQFWKTLPPGTDDAGAVAALSDHLMNAYRSGTVDAGTAAINILAKSSDPGSVEHRAAKDAAQKLAAEHQTTMRAEGPSRAAREAPRAPSEVIVHLMSAVRAESAKQPNHPALAKITEGARTAMFEHKLTVEQTRQLLADAKKLADDSGLKDLSALIETQMTAKLPASTAAMPLTRLHDNVYGRVFESKMMAAVVESSPQDVATAMTATARATADWLSTELSRDGTITVVKRLQSDLRTGDPRFWADKVPALGKIRDATTDDERLQALDDYLRAAKSTGHESLSVPYVMVKMWNSIGQAKPVDWKRKGDKNYVDVIMDEAHRYSPTMSHAETEGAGITLRHQPTAVIESGASPSKRPSTVSTPKIGPDDKVTASTREALYHGIPFAAGVSGTTNIMLHLSEFLKNGPVPDLDAKSVLLGTMMFVVHDGGHSMHEALWTANQLDASLNLGLRLGDSSKPKEFVADYSKFIRLFEGGNTHPILTDASAKAIDATLDYFDTHSHYSPGSRSAPRPSDAGQRTDATSPSAAPSGMPAPSSVASGQTQSSSQAQGGAQTKDTSQAPAQGTSQTEHGVQDAYLQSLIEQSNTWSHPPSNADRAAATKVLGDVQKVHPEVLDLAKQSNFVAQYHSNVSAVTGANDASAEDASSIIAADTQSPAAATAGFSPRAATSKAKGGLKRLFSKVTSTSKSKAEGPSARRERIHVDGNKLIALSEDNTTTLRRWNPTHREWYLEQATLLDAYRATTDDATRRALALQVLNAFYKVATIDQMKANEQARQISPFLPQGERYHRSTGNLLLDRVHVAYETALGFTSPTPGKPLGIVHLVDNITFREVLARDIFTPDLSPPMAVNDLGSFGDSVRTLLEKVDAREETSLDDKVLFDVSPLLDAHLGGQPLSAAELDRFTSKLERTFLDEVASYVERNASTADFSATDFIKKLANVVPGTNVVAFSQYPSQGGRPLLVTPRFLDNANEAATTAFPDAPRDLLDKSGNKHYQLVQSIGSALSKSGYRVDPMTAKEAWLDVETLEAILAREDIPLTELGTEAPRTTPVTEPPEDGLERLLEGQVFKGFAALGHDPAFENEPYVNVLTNGIVALLNGLGALQKGPNAIDIQGRFDGPALQGLLKTAYFRMEEAMREAKAFPRDFFRFLDATEVIHQQIQTILQVVQPYGDTDFARGYLGHLGDTIPSGLTASAEAYPSAMHGLATALAGVEAQKGSNALNIAVLKDSYYESAEAITKAKTFDVVTLVGDTVRDGQPLGDVSFTQGTAKEPGKEPPPKPLGDIQQKKLDVFVGEFRHNISYKRDVYTLEDLEHHVDQLFANDLVSEKFTVVIDDTIDKLRSERVQSFLEHNRERITSGALNVVVLRSAQKFDMLGADNYYGGFAVNVNDPKSFASFNQRIQDPDDRLKGLSRQGLTHLATHAGTHLDRYRAAVMKNTQTLYDAIPDGLKHAPDIPPDDLRNLMKVSAIEGDDGQVFLAIDFMGHEMIQGEFAKELKAFAQKHGLPLDERSSFGFATSNLTTISDIERIRFNPGLEGAAQIAKYGEFFTNWFNFTAPIVAKHVANGTTKTKTLETELVLALRGTPGAVQGPPLPPAAPPARKAAISAPQQRTAPAPKGMKDTELQALIAQSNGWSHAPTDADRAAATQALGDLMRAYGADRALVDRLGELIRKPESISQYEFATCALTGTVYSLLKNDLGGFARLVTSVFSGKLFDRDGNLVRDFSLDAAAPRKGVLDPIEAVLDGTLDVASAGIQNKLLSNAVKKAQAKRSDLENKGEVWSDRNVLDYLLSRSLGKMLSKLAPEQYDADLATTAQTHADYRKKALEERPQDADGPSKKHGDLLLSADSLVTLFDRALGVGAQTMVEGRDYDIDNLNAALSDPARAPFAFARMMNGKALHERAQEHARDPSATRPFDDASEIDPSTAHQVVVNGPITFDGTHYTVPVHSWQQSFPVKVAKDMMPKLFPAITYGSFLSGGAPGQAPAHAEASMVTGAPLIVKDVVAKLDEHGHDEAPTTMEDTAAEDTAPNEGQSAAAATTGWSPRAAVAKASRAVDKITSNLKSKPEAPPTGHERSHVDENRLVAPHESNTTPLQDWNPTHREWYLDQATLLDAYRNATDAAIKKQLALLMMHSLYKAAAIHQDKADAQGRQISAFLSEGGTYHRSTANPLLDQVHIAYETALGFPLNESKPGTPSGMVHLLDNDRFSEVLEREYALTIDGVPLAQRMDDLDHFRGTVQKLLEHIDRRDPKLGAPPVLFDVSSLLAERLDGAALSAAAAQSMAAEIESAFLDEVTRFLAEKGGDDTTTKAFVDKLSKVVNFRMQVVAFTKHPPANGRPVLVTPRLLDGTNKHRDDLPAKMQDIISRLPNMRHRSLSEQLGESLSKSGYRVDPVTAMKAWLDIESVESIFEKEGIPLTTLATKPGPVPTIHDGIQSFLGPATTFATFKQFAATRPLAEDPGVKILSRGTVALLEGLRAMETQRGVNVQRAFEEKGLGDLLQTAYFRMETAMKEAMTFSGPKAPRAEPSTKLKLEVDPARKDRRTEAHFANQMEIIHQQVQAILEIVQPYQDADFGAGVITYLGDTIPKGLTAQAEVYPSAMHTLASTLAAVEEQKGTNELNVGVLEDSYYESAGAIDHAKTYDVVTLAGTTPRKGATLDDGKSNAKTAADVEKKLDVFLGQFRHNISEERSVYAIEDLTSLVDQLFENDRVADKFTVVIDNTIDQLKSEHVQRFLEHNRPRIESGQLNVAIFRSAQKFDMLGMDNYYGGFVVNVNDPKSFASFNQRIQDPGDRLKGLNRQGLTHTLTHMGEQLDAYRAGIMASTKALYETLPAGLKHDPTQVLADGDIRTEMRVSMIEDDDKQVFLDIDFNPKGQAYYNAFIAELKTFIEANDLPVDERSSFGFAVSNLTGLPKMGKIRFNPGLERPEQLEKYAEFFKRWFDFVAPRVGTMETTEILDAIKDAGIGKAPSPTAITTGFSPGSTPKTSSTQTPTSTQTAKGEEAPNRDATENEAPFSGEALEDLIARSNTWSHPPSSADRAEASKILGDLMHAQGADAALIARLGELIQNPSSISQDAFSTCALTSSVHALLQNDLGGFARLVTSVFTGQLLDRDGNLIRDFSLDSPAPQSTVTDPIQRVLDGTLDVKSAGIQNKLLSNGVKKAQAKRSDLKRKGQAWSNDHLLDYLLSRSLGKMLSKMAPAQYEADLRATEDENPGYRDKKATRPADATGPSKKHGDLLLSADSLVTLFGQVFGVGAQIMVDGEDYDLDVVNEALSNPSRAPFAFATMMNGEALYERAQEFEADPAKVRPFDDASEVDPKSAHQVVITGPITFDGTHYTVPLHSWQKDFSIQVTKDVMPTLFPAITYGSFLSGEAPGPTASSATVTGAPKRSRDGGGEPPAKRLKTGASAGKPREATGRQNFDEDVNTLEEISVLFIPFDAAGGFYKKNAEKGVRGFEGSLDTDGSRNDAKNHVRSLVPAGAKDHFLARADIGKELSNIVEQECELVRNMHNPDSAYPDNLDALVKSARDDASRWSERRKEKVERNLKGYENYPTLLFLSENPTGSAFPDKIDTKIHGMGYVKKLAIDSTNVSGIRAVNQMAVYVREDVDNRISSSAGDEDGLYFTAEQVTRKTHGLFKGGKDEYILKATIGRKAGESLTVAGVHLRATLTSSNPASRDQERKDLQKFCDAEGIQLLVGDFNMDLQESTQGSRGVFFDNKPENQPRFLIGETSPVAVPQYVQQYSNSAGNAHYMGYLQADTDGLRTVGPSVYGRMGASGSRSLQEGGKYYSDHPSVYVGMESRRVTEEAKKAILKRKAALISDRLSRIDRGTPMDGNCLYHALIQAQNGGHVDANAAATLRQFAVEWVLRDENLGLVSEYAFNHGVWIDDLVGTLAQNGNWAGQAGDLVPRVLASALQTTIVVHQPSGAPIRLEPLNGESQRTIEVDLQDNHYSVHNPSSSAQQGGQSSGTSKGKGPSAKTTGYSPGSSSAATARSDLGDVAKDAATTMRDRVLVAARERVAAAPQTFADGKVDADLVHLAHDAVLAMEGQILAANGGSMPAATGHLTQAVAVAMVDRITAAVMAAGPSALDDAQLADALARLAQDTATVLENRATGATNAAIPAAFLDALAESLATRKGCGC